ncbi:unnamed protein product [Coregonus sp. 'balchen']|nr:unnamed protein product [Coregonus sp. 'balchen']
MNLDAMLGPQQFRGVANFSTFLLDRSSGVLFLGARDAILAVDTNNLAQPPRTGEIVWDVPEEKRRSCVAKGKTEGDCNNYIRLLEFLGDGWIYACGTYAFDPQCAFVNMSSFSLERGEDGGEVSCPKTGPKSPFRGTCSIPPGNPGQEKGTYPPPRKSINGLFGGFPKGKKHLSQVLCGGMKTLQRRWTTFLKAQLVCEDRASGQRYNILTDYEELSAVCVYSLADISKVMDGPFKELKKTCENWINPEPVPTPRPGQCLNSALRAEGFESSLKLPDKVLTFMRDHPLMENSVIAVPILVRRGVTYTKVAVTRTTTLSQSNAATVLHLGTEPVNNILLHKGQALVGTPLSLARVGAEGCSLYTNCEVCARARPLGCVWRAKEGTCGPSMTEPIQGEEVEDALKLCDSGEGRCSPALRELRVSVGLHVLLPCVQVSPRPYTPVSITLTWRSLSQWRAWGHTHVYVSLGVAIGCFLLHFLSRQRGIGQRHPDHSLSSEKGQDLLGSSATPQSPSSASLLSEGFPLTEKRGNGTLLLTHHHNNGNDGHHGNYGVVGSNGGYNGNRGNGGGHGNGGYANNANCNVQTAASAVDGLKLHVQEMVTGERSRGERESGRPERGQGDEEDEGLGEGLVGLEEELAGFALFKLPAPLAQCEESSI